MFVPKLYTMGNSRPSMNSTGVMVLSSERNSTSILAPTAHRIYSGISSLIRALVSCRMTLMPPKKVSFRSTFLICWTAFIVSSLALGPSNRTMSMVESFLPNMNCCTSAGSISVGMLGSITSLSQKVWVTPGTASMSFFMAISSFVGKPSTVIIPVEARWKSSSRATSPIMESRSCGR